MEEKQSISFFEQFTTAFFAPKSYDKLLTLKKRYRVGYIALLMLLLVIIENVIPFAAWSSSVGGFDNLIANRLPRFQLENGQLHIDQPVEFELSGVIHVSIDSNIQEFTEKDLNSKYTEEILISKNNILVTNNMIKENILFKNLGELKLNNKGLLQVIPFLYFTVGLSFLFSFIYKLGIYLLMTVFLAFLCKTGVRSLDGSSVSWRDTMIIAFYAQSLFAIMSSINICLGYPLSNFFMTLVTIFFTMMYIYKAQATIISKL